MKPIVFVSHSNAGTDKDAARRVVDALREADIDVRIDHDMRLGSDFVLFMRDALDGSDHCLVLWSRNAATSAYVEAEMSAAFVIDLKQRPSYLLFARLDDEPLPSLFLPRLCVDLSSDWSGGLRRVVELVRRDDDVRSSTGKAVTAPEGSLNGEAPVEVYVCSGVFQRTMVIRADPDEAAGVFLDRVLRVLGAPHTVDHNGRIGVRLRYVLRGPGGPVATDKSLAAQGIDEGKVIWLEVECEPFALGRQVEGSEPGRPRYRADDDGPSIRPDSVVMRAVESAGTVLSARLSERGLRDGTPLPIGLIYRSRRSVQR